MRGRGAIDGRGGVKMGGEEVGEDLAALATSPELELIPVDKFGGP